MDQWGKLAAEVDNPLLQAVAGAFVLVACSDAELAPQEIDRFLDVMKTAGIKDLERMDATFRALAAEVLTDYQAGQQRALQLIAAVKGQPAASLVIDAARIAVVADHRLKEIEERVLAQVCEALGVDPANA